jgi:DNA mismatch endonuclease (patch repair protein)
VARFRKNVASLPGRPDVVFPRVHLAVFCDGDFWHGKDWSVRRATLAQGTNAPYWIAKIEANRARDRRHTAALRADGWIVLRFWESAIHATPDAVVHEILSTLRGLTGR